MQCSAPLKAAAADQTHLLYNGQSWAFDAVCLAIPVPMRVLLRIHQTRHRSGHPRVEMGVFFGRSAIETAVYVEWRSGYSTGHGYSRPAGDSVYDGGRGALSTSK